LFEQTEVYLLYSAWLLDELLPSFLLLGGFLGLAVLCNLGLGFRQQRTTLMLILAVCVGHLLVGGFLAWDLLLSGLTSLLE
jgi:hypothetical protein